MSRLTLEETLAEFKKRQKQQENNDKIISGNNKLTPEELAAKNAESKKMLNDLQNTSLENAAGESSVYRLFGNKLPPPPSPENAAGESSVYRLFGNKLPPPPSTEIDAGGGSASVSSDHMSPHPKEKGEENATLIIQQELDKKIELMNFLITKYKILESDFKIYIDLSTKITDMKEDKDKNDKIKTLNNLIDNLFKKTVKLDGIKTPLAAVYDILKTRVLFHVNSSEKIEKYINFVQETLGPNSEMSFQMFSFLKTYMEQNNMKGGKQRKSRRRKQRKSRRQKPRKSRRRL